MNSQVNEKKQLIRPELVEIAELHATINLVTDLSILKPQIKLYYKGRHFTSGSKPSKGLFWISCLDENKLTEMPHLIETIRDPAIPVTIYLLGLEF